MISAPLASYSLDLNPAEGVFNGRMSSGLLSPLHDVKQFAMQCKVTSFSGPSLDGPYKDGTGREKAN